MKSVYQTFFLKSLATLTRLLSRRGLSHILTATFVFSPKKMMKLEHEFNEIRPPTKPVHF